MCQELTLVPPLPASSDDDRACAHFERTSPKMPSCARCGIFYYCGKDCQSALWKNHKPRYIPKADRVPQPVGTSQRPPDAQRPAKDGQ